jgi:hypothetical protein
MLHPTIPGVHRLCPPPITSSTPGNGCESLERQCLYSIPPAISEQMFALLKTVEYYNRASSHEPSLFPKQELTNEACYRKGQAASTKKICGLPVKKLCKLG